MTDTTQAGRPATWDEIAERVKALGFKYPSGGENIGTLVIDMLLALEARAAARLTAEVIDKDPKPGFISQIEASKRSVKSWPKWMRNTATTASATLPLSSPSQAQESREPKGAR